MDRCLSLSLVSCLAFPFTVKNRDDTNENRCFFSLVYDPSFFFSFSTDDRIFAYDDTKQENRSTSYRRRKRHESCFERGYKYRPCSYEYFKDFDVVRRVTFSFVSCRGSVVFQRTTKALSKSLSRRHVSDFPEARVSRTSYFVSRIFPLFRILLYWGQETILYFAKLDASLTESYVKI